MRYDVAKAKFTGEQKPAVHKIKNGRFWNVFALLLEDPDVAFVIYKSKARPTMQAHCSKLPPSRFVEVVNLEFE